MRCSPILARTGALLALLACASFTSAGEARAQGQAAMGTVRVRNRAQLPIAEFTIGREQKLVDRHLLPRGTVDIAVRPGTYEVKCTVGYRKGTAVDIIFPRFCAGTVTAIAGQVTVYEVRRITPAQVLSHVILGVDGGDPAFGGRGATPAMYKAPTRDAAGVVGVSVLLVSQSGAWSLRSSSESSRAMTGTVSEVSWADMSTRFTFTLNGKFNASIDRPYFSLTLPTGPSLTANLNGGSLLQYRFCGFVPGPAANWFPNSSC